MKLFITFTFTTFSIITFAQGQNNLLFNAFKQGIVESDSKRAGNCASVAIIKSAIGQFGIDNVFHFSNTKNTNKVTLKDGTSFEINDIELGEAKKMSGFIPGDTTKIEVNQIFKYANLCFAVLCKNYQLNSFKDKPFKFVINQINNGYQTEEIYKLLGLKATSLDENPSYEVLRKYKHLVLWNSAHAVYFSEGFYDEAFNKNKPIEKIENLKERHCNVGGWLRNGCKPRGAYMLVE